MAREINYYIVAADVVHGLGVGIGGAGCAPRAGILA